MITADQSQEVGKAAGETLSAFDTISSAARARLAAPSRPLGDALAVQNSFTGEKAIETLASVERAEREASQRLSREPAIARVVVAKDDGSRETIYIARAAPPKGGGVKVASYRSPLGRLASLEPGDTLEAGPRDAPEDWEVVERAHLTPQEDGTGWDAHNTVFETSDFGPVTVESLRRLIEAAGKGADVDDDIDRMLLEDEAIAQVAQGWQKAIIDKMGLRDQPALDKLQDRLFRMPIDTRLAVLGAPGSGKTTTLVKRLGQKLDRDILLASGEYALIERAAIGGGDAHEHSWLMFAPNELLRGYVKDAFAEEGIAAPDSRIRTWAALQRELARSYFPILQGGLPGGSWRMREDDTTLLPATLGELTSLFDDFDTWQVDLFWSELAAAASTLDQSEDLRMQRLAAELRRAIERRDAASRRLVALADLAPDIRQLLELLRSDLAARFRIVLNRYHGVDRTFIDRLAGFMDTLVEAEEADGDADGEEEDEAEQQAHTPRARAVQAFNAALRLRSRRRIEGRRLGRGRSAAILAWLDEQSDPAIAMSEIEQDEAGRLIVAQSALRVFSNPVAGFVNGVSRRFRGFRRARRSEGRWFSPEGSSRVVSIHEVDLMLLAALRAANHLISDADVRRRLDETAFDVARAVALLHRNQILVDEVTDFTPLQLACMAALANPQIGSVFVCGDFNQRITPWGMTRRDQLGWAVEGLAIEDVNIAYRQSRQLYEFGRALADATGGHPTAAVLPANRDNEGVRPALGIGLAGGEDVSAWLAARIVEVERALRPRTGLPSTAVLVAHEALVEPVAAALDAALDPFSLRAVPCVRGQIVGQRGDVRVFDVQHVKGLEFEVVFFLGIDRLAETLPSLFDRYLYVGATRAATYLGVTCETDLPPMLEPLRSQFGNNWGDIR